MTATSKPSPNDVRVRCPDCGKDGRIVSAWVAGAKGFSIAGCDCEQKREPDRAKE